MWRALIIACLLASPAAGQEFFTLKGHGGPIMDIAVSPAGQIATASFDNSVGVWADDQPTWLEGNRAAVNAVEFATDTTVLAGGDDFSVWSWDTDHPKPVLIGKHTAKVSIEGVSRVVCQRKLGCDGWGLDTQPAKKRTWQLLDANIPEGPHQGRQ